MENGLSPATLGLAVALGCGLLIGVERERRKGRGPRREAAGLRTFTIVAVAGGLAQWSDVPGLVAVGAALVAALATVAYFRSTRGAPAPEVDPGLTTEIALFVTYLIGVVAVLMPMLGAACGAGLAGLLAARDRLHRFATHWLSQAELHDGLLLAALALIALPLVPAAPIVVLGGVTLRPLAVLVVLILVLQAAAHVALRVLGTRGALLLVGFVSGFVSSTATVATMGRRARHEPAQARASAAGGAASGAATWVLAVIVVGALAPGAIGSVAPIAAVGAVVAAVLAWWLMRRTGSKGGRGRSAESAEVAEAARARTAANARGATDIPGAAERSAHGATSAPATLAASRRDGPLRLREAFLLAALLFGVSAAVAVLTRWLGPQAALPGAALAALADAHAAVAALASLVQARTLPAAMLPWGMLLAVTVNTAMRIGVATVTGGRVFAARVAVALVTSLAAAAGAAAALRGLGC